MAEIHRVSNRTILVLVLCTNAKFPSATYSGNSEKEEREEREREEKSMNEWISISLRHMM